MFNPKRAAEDNYFMVIGACIIVAFISILFANANFNSGGKYFLLTNFAAETEGKVINIHKNPQNGENPDSFKLFIDNQYNGAIKLVTLQFIPHSKPEEFIIITRLLGDRSLPLNSKIRILYLSASPKISYPKIIIEEFSFDFKLLKIALIVLTGSVSVGFYMFFKWLNFKNKQRYY